MGLELSKKKNYRSFEVSGSLLGSSSNLYSMHTETKKRDNTPNESYTEINLKTNIFLPVSVKSWLRIV